MKKLVHILTGKKPGGKSDAGEFYNDLAADIMARTIWGEARNEGAVGMGAVACVVLNRVAKAQLNGGKYWWAQT